MKTAAKVRSFGVSDAKLTQSPQVRQQLVKYESSREALRQWFNERRWAKVYPILSSSDEISLRVLEYLTDPVFVAECEQLGVPLSYYIETKDSKTGQTHQRLFNLPEQLAATQYVVVCARVRAAHQRSHRRYSMRKKFMEPFARQNHDLPNNGRFKFGYDEKQVETNVAQLQFMRFVVENNVLDWLRTHKNSIFEARSRTDDAGGGGGGGGKRQKTAA
jgi:hypothetical protein